MYKQKFKEDLENYLTKFNYQESAIVSYSDFEDFHYQTPLLFSLKKKHSNFDPQTLLDYLKDTNHYEKVEITGNGFISLKFKLSAQEQHQKKQQTVLVDYCGINVAKQMHIGHIRSMFIGDFVTRLHQNQGDKVVLQNHIGDWGNQFGFLLNYIKQNKLESNLDNKKLTQYYKESYSKTQEDKEFAESSAKVAYNLQNFKDPALYDLWKKLVSISMSEAQNTFKELNLKMDIKDTQGESFYAPMCKAVLEDLMSKGLAVEGNDNSIICEFENKSPLVLKKSNGNYLYALYDIAAIKWRSETYNPDKIVYVVDKRQSLHFEQVFEVAKKAGYSGSTELNHLGFGTILGKDKKPLKTKEGESLYLDVLLEQGKDLLLSDEHFVKMNESFKNEILNKTIIGGLKFYDLKFTKHQDYVFDWTHVLNFTGGSAPYIQNAIVRIDSILYKKFGEKSSSIQLDLNWNHNWSTLESSILFQCQKTDEMLSELDSSYSSQLLTNQMINLCQLFHKYYESEKVLGSVTEGFKLQLLTYIKNKLELTCNVLGIETYDCEQKLLLKNNNKKAIKSKNTF